MTALLLTTTVGVIFVVSALLAFIVAAFRAKTPSSFVLWTASVFGSLSICLTLGVWHTYWLHKLLESAIFSGGLP